MYYYNILILKCFFKTKLGMHHGKKMIQVIVYFLKANKK